MTKKALINQERQCSSISLLRVHLTGVMAGKLDSNSSAAVDQETMVLEHSPSEGRGHGFVVRVTFAFRTGECKADQTFQQ